jgi:hypothetical protein
VCLIFFFFFPLNLILVFFTNVDNAYDFCSVSSASEKAPQTDKSAAPLEKKRDQNKKLLSLSLSLSLSPRLLYDNGDEEYAFLRRDVV